MEIDSLLCGKHSDPHRILGIHRRGNRYTIRAVFPWAKEAWVLSEGKRYRMERYGDTPLFKLNLGEKISSYFYEVEYEGGKKKIEDPYRFLPNLGEQDLYLFNEGKHYELWNKMGAQVKETNGIKGTSFAVWAPNAKGISVVGNFNRWHPLAHPMRELGNSGVWELFLPGISEKELYKFRIMGRNGEELFKTDPYGFYFEIPPKSASIVWDSNKYTWQDGEWIKKRREYNLYKNPLSIYEVHLGSWARVPEEGNRWLTYRETAHKLIPYVKKMGFTHIELLPVMEHPFYGSWGYQTTGYFAPTSRYGNPDDFKYLVDYAHQNGLGIILDWTPAHFPTDPYGLARFDGTALYEHEDPKKGYHPDWHSFIFNYGRKEVSNFLTASALFWTKEYHVDGLRVDGVASMLYLDYSRKPGEWSPNKYGGRENLEAIEFIREMNKEIYARGEGTFTIAEESTAWPMVSKPVHLGGLGFGFKWNMGWMNDTLFYFSKDPIYRKYHHNKLTFSIWYAFSENFILPLSHDEVAHGKGSLLGKMPGDIWQKFANLRLLLAYHFAHPGKKLLFMGGEIAQWKEWNHEESIDWHLLKYESHRGIQKLTQELNKIYRNEPSLHQRDCEAQGFRWIDLGDSLQSVVSFARTGDNGEFIVCVFNFTPAIRHNYRIGVPESGFYRELLNTDSEIFGGSNVGNFGGVYSQKIPSHGFPCSLELTLPPLAALYLKKGKE